MHDFVKYVGIPWCVFQLCIRLKFVAKFEFKECAERFWQDTTIKRLKYTPNILLTFKYCKLF